MGKLAYVAYEKISVFGVWSGEEKRSSKECVASLFPLKRLTDPAFHIQF